jgi:hypothetical protein
MKTVTVNELKKELAGLSSRKTLEICIRLAKYKKENKELLTYLLFKAHDEQEFIRNVKSTVDAQFEGINRSNIYYIKKGMRKILRITNKYARYSGNKQTEADLLIHFCGKFHELNIPFRDNVTLSNMYHRQIQKIRKASKTLHEDLQYDIEKEMDHLG